MHDENGYEVPDQTPVAIPVGFKQPETLQETIRRLVRGALSDQAAAGGAETFEEADDLDVGDDYDPSSPWELSADQEEAREQRPPRWQEEAAKAGWRPRARSWEDEARESGWAPPSQAAADPPVQGGSGGTPET